MATFTDTFTDTNGVDLSAHVADTGETYTKQSGTGALQIAGNELRAITTNQSAYYTSSWTPGGADQRLTVGINFLTGTSEMSIAVGLHCEAGGDGIFVQWETFTGGNGALTLLQVDGGSETTLDTGPNTGDCTVIVEIENDLIRWEVDGVEQGSGITLVAGLQPNGLVGLSKFGQVGTSDGIQITQIETEDIGGGTNADVVAVPADATGDVPAPTLGAGANVVAPPADGVGSLPLAGNEISSEVAASPADGAGSLSAPTVTATGDGSVTAVPADATGDVPSPTASAGAVLDAPTADGTGDLPAPSVSAGVAIDSPPLDGSGDLVAPGVTGGGATGPPDVALPASLTLDAHLAITELDAHLATLTLAEHIGALALDAHGATVTLDVHATSVELDAHSTLLELAAHKGTLELHDHRATLTLDS